MTTSLENVVIGGGLAGPLIAFRLASSGRQVVLLEKQREPHHKVCGEFLSAEALSYLSRIGIDPLDLGARSIRRVRLHSGNRSVAAALPFSALSLSRRVLDEALLQKAQSAGCQIRRGTFVEKVSRGSRAFSLRLRNSQTLQASNIFLATGKHDLADLPRPTGTHCDLVGFKMHWQLAPQSIDAVRQTMELFLFQDGYGGLALVENDIGNLSFVIHQGRMRKLGGWPQMLAAIRHECPAVDQILGDARQCWPKPLAISPIPYGYIARASNGIWRVGDQAAVIPSFTGDGMSIALHSAELASEMFLCGRSPNEYLVRLRAHLLPGLRFATWLSRMMLTSTGRLLVPPVLSLVPGAIGWIAEQTRIPRHALKTTGLAPPATEHFAPSV